VTHQLTLDSLLRVLPFHVRQGDVLVVEVDAIPDDARRLEPDDGRVVLAYGEATGHAHAIRAAGAALLERQGETARYLHLDAPASLEHEEHAPIELPAGAYRVVIQREYVPASPATRTTRDWRSVAD